MHTIWRDVRFAIRSFTKDPSFSLIVVLALSLGIGATTSIFSVVNAVVIQPLPYPDADRLVHVGTEMTDGRATGGTLNPFALSRLNSESTNIERFAGAFAFDLAIQDRSNRPIKTEAYVVTEGYFDVFGAPMTIGRGFTPDEHIGVLSVAQGGSIVLSHRLWTNAFAADPSILGTSIPAGDVSFTVVGVADPDFDFPVGADVWIAVDPGTEETAFYLTGVARLADGSSLQQGRAELEVLAQRFEQESPSFRTRTIVATDLKEWIVGDTSHTLMILLAAAATLLLISCANVMTLLLSRGAARSREVALRAALGAGRGRLAQQLATEALTLAAVGAVTGLVATRVSLAVLEAVGSDQLPRSAEVGIDPTVLGFTLLLTAVTGVLFGLVPALRLLTTDIKSLMGGSARGGSGGRGAARIFNALVLAQTGLAVVLVIGAGLLVRSFDQLRRTDAGFEPDSVLVMDMNLPAIAYPSYDEVVRLYEELLDDLRDVPGVSSVAAAASIPFGPTGPLTMAQDILGAETSDAPPRAEVRAVTPGYFQTLGAQRREGRPFTVDDRLEGPGVMIVSESYVTQILQDAPPLGQQVGFGSQVIRDPANPVMYQRVDEWEIVGVVDDVKYESPRLPPVPTVYVPHSQLNVRRMLVSARTGEVAPADITDEARALVRSIDPTLPVEFTTAEDLVSESLGDERLAMLLLLAFGLSAAALAAVGIYGVISLSVQRRIPEMAIRTALGAEPVRILWLAMVRGLTLGGLGIALGTMAAIIGRSIIASQLYEIRATDPLVMIGAPLVLGLVAFVAVLVPALRTRRIDLSFTLSAEA